MEDEEQCEQEKKKKTGKTTQYALANTSLDLYERMTETERGITSLALWLPVFLERR